MSLSSSYPLPALQPDTKLSFQPYPIASRQSLHSTLLSTSIRGAAPPSTATTSHAGSVQRAAPASWSSTRSPQAGPGPTSESIKSERKARQRAERRAVAGRRPAGVGLGPDADELSDEEEALEQERARIDMFGHRFLLPIGRRQTQMEMDQAPSPEPSEADQDRRQEDRGIASPTTFMHQPMDEDEPGGELDLDADVEDLDADVEDLDASMEDRDGGDYDDEDE